MASAGTDMRFCYRNQQSRAVKEQSAEERTSGRSCSHGVGERERERLRIVRKEGKYRSISILDEGASKAWILRIPVVGWASAGLPS